MTLITHRFRTFMRKKKQIFRWKPFSKDDPSKEKEKEKELPICYECKKSGHFKIHYFLLKKSIKKIKKKATMATWSDNDDSSSDEKIYEVANLYLMVQKEKITSKIKFEFTFNELQDAFYDVLDEFKKFRLKIRILKNLIIP